MELGLARVAGDTRLYWDLLVNLARHWEDTMADFDTALRDQDAARLQLLAHKLKGVAGNLGAADLEQRAARLEAAARQPFGEAVQNCHTTLGACFQELSQLILELPDLPARQFSHSSQALPLEAQLQKLLTELDNCDGEALETWSELAVRLRCRLSAELIDHLDQLVSNFDFASARQALQANLI